MWQTRHAIARLATRGMVSTVLQISTKGDRVLDRSLAAIGGDSLFVKELELALRERRADYAVHSCKDLPSSLPEDMTLAAIGPREDPRDAFCSERYASFEALPPGALVGTSSPRRRAQLQARRPDLRFDTIRGNVDTRLRKLAEGEFDAILLAAASTKSSPTARASWPCRRSGPSCAPCAAAAKPRSARTRRGRTASSRSTVPSPASTAPGSSAPPTRAS
jgi:hydroxymethylbilane synthase